MKKLTLLLLSASIFQGCAHGERSSVEIRLDEKLSQETQIKRRADLRAEAAVLIANASSLTPQQKSELTSLQASAATQMDKIRTQSLKLRAVLIEDLISSHYAANEVDLIKRRLRDLEHQKLSVFFSAVRDANTILGRWASRSERRTGEVLDEMMLDLFLYY